MRLSVLFLLIALLVATAVLAAGAGDVEVHLNGGADLLIAPGVNHLEIWLANDAALKGISLAFEFVLPHGVQVEWNYLYGGATAPVMEHGDAIGVWDLGGLQVLAALDGVSPDSILIGGASLYSVLPAHYPESRRCYSMQFEIVSAPPQGLALCVDNIFYPPGGYWLFNEGGSDYPPLYNGNDNRSPRYPDAPAICFAIAQLGCGDVQGDGLVNISDVVYLISYIFAGGPPPLSPESGDADCDSLTNISDVVYLISYIFSGGLPPCAAC